MKYSLLVTNTAYEGLHFYINEVARAAKLLQETALLHSISQHVLRL